MLLYSLYSHLKESAKCVTRRSFLLAFFALLGHVELSPAQAAPGMLPVVSTSRSSTSYKSQKTTAKRKAQLQKKKEVKRKNKQTRTLNKVASKESQIDLTLLRRLETQIYQVRTSRRRWEDHKQGLLAEFANRQSAFAVSLPGSDLVQHGHSILLALSSKSMDDFVHGKVIMKYLTDSQKRRHQTYVNLVHNLQHANFVIQSFIKMEQQFLQQWNAERARITAHQRRQSPGKS